MPNLSHLVKQFETFEQACDGILGVSARHLESDQRIQFNAGKLFLMCSTYKVAIAVYLLHLCEQKTLDMHSLCEVRETDLLPGVMSALNQLDWRVPQQLSLHSLLRCMLQESCNSSTGIILKIIGGAEALDAYLKQHGIHGIGMDFYSFDMFAVWDGIKQLPPHCTLEQYSELELAVPAAEVAAARIKMMADIESTGEASATPDAMTDLLSRLYRGELVSTTSAELILTIMRGCKRGALRLMGLLPARTPIAHKTGTLTGYTCDIGIITLPHQAGHIAISAFIKQSSKDLANNERVLAEVGRSVYDYFLFNL